MFTAGQIITNDDGFSGTVSDDNIVCEIIAAGKTWQAYAESIPSIGYLGGDSIRTPSATTSCPATPTSPPIRFKPPTSCPSRNSKLMWLTARRQTSRSLSPNLLNDAHDTTLSLAVFWLQQT
jgi:hypothetical protein